MAPKTPLTAGDIRGEEEPRRRRRRMRAQQRRQQRQFRKMRARRAKIARRSMKRFGQEAASSDATPASLAIAAALGFVVARRF